MAYTALEAMRAHNEERLGVDVGPVQPLLAAGADVGFDLRSCALRLIHERCEDLRFDTFLTREEERSGRYLGTSLTPNQIPHAMQMDIDRLCLERSVERFLGSGSLEDAYDVYYCFMEMFLGSYGRSAEMVELLSDYETNGSSLLMEHRDHYSHSVYVFVLGLAIYEANETFRRTFDAFYGFEVPEGARSSEAANFFIEFWGLTSLFHDIGYPFELTFEQVMSYFALDEDERGKACPYVIYRNIESMTGLSEREQDVFERMYGRHFATVDELIAKDLTDKLGATYHFSEDYLLEVLRKKAVSPEDFWYYMDHAYFSGLRLFRELMAAMDRDNSAIDAFVLRPAHVDALGAIMLHYDLFTYSLATCEGAAQTTMSMDVHPLAWLLMLCDELQCWDRTAYGRNTRSALHPMGATFDLANDQICACYLFDEGEQKKIDTYRRLRARWEEEGAEGKPPRLKSFSDMADGNPKFVGDIAEIVDLSRCPLSVTCATTAPDRSSKHAFLSDSSFLHLHDFAVALNARYAHEGHEDEADPTALEAEFEALSLEYKLSNINQAKSFARYLDAIGCFYTDRPVDFDMLLAFTPDEVEVFAPMEHERWVVEHQAMGWCAGQTYEEAAVPAGEVERAWRKALREQLRCHKLALDGELTHERAKEHYLSLSPEDQGKDWLPFNSMLRLIEQFDGLRIYRLTRERGA